MWGPCDPMLSSVVTPFYWQQNDRLTDFSFLMTFFLSCKYIIYKNPSGVTITPPVSSRIICVYVEVVRLLVMHTISGLLTISGSVVTLPLFFYLSSFMNLYNILVRARASRANPQTSPLFTT